MPSIGPDRKPWPITDGEVTPTRWATFGNIYFFLGIGYGVIGLFLGLSERKILGGIFVSVGLACVFWAVDSLFIKDILPFGDFKPPSSIGGVIRMISIAAVAVISFLFGIGLLVSGAVLLELI